MNHKNYSAITILVLVSFLVGCAAPIKGTVFKQRDGSYKATYSGKTEKHAIKTTHLDAVNTCKNKAKTKDIIVVEQKIDSMTEKAKGEQSGFSAVAGSAVTAMDKYFGSENVRATLIFECDKG